MMECGLTRTWNSVPRMDPWVCSWWMRGVSDVGKRFDSVQKVLKKAVKVQINLHVQCRLSINLIILQSKEQKSLLRKQAFQQQLTRLLALYLCSPFISKKPTLPCRSLRSVPGEMPARDTCRKNQEAALRQTDFLPDQTLGLDDHVGDARFLSSVVSGRLSEEMVGRLEH